MKRILVLVVLGICLTPAMAAGQTTLLTPHPEYQKWLLNGLVPGPNVTVQIEDHGCVVNDDYAAGCTSPGGSIFIAYEDSRYLRRKTLWHELGHQFDYVHMDETRRQHFMIAAGLIGAWRQPLLRTQSPHEIFAEVYKQCAMHRVVKGRWRPPQNEGPASGQTNRSMARLCDLVEDFHL